MAKTFRYKLAVWGWGAVSAAVGALGGAIAAPGFAKLIGAADFTLKQLAVLMLTTAVSAVGGYMKTKPLPTFDDYESTGS